MSPDRAGVINSQTKNYMKRKVDGRKMLEPQALPPVSSGLWALVSVSPH